MIIMRTLLFFNRFHRCGEGKDGRSVLPFYMQAPSDTADVIDVLKDGAHAKAKTEEDKEDRRMLCIKF